MADGTTFEVKVIARLLMLDERRIQQLAAQGYIPKAERGRYGLVDAVQGYIKYLKEHGRDSSRGQEHSRLARAQATKVEMENYRRMGELQTTAQVEETTQGLVVMMKTSLEGMPSRLASELAGIADPPAIYQRLQSELREVLDRCADFLEKRATTLEGMPEPGINAPPLEEADPHGLGGEESGDAAG